MTQAQVKIAVAEAERFLDRAKVVLGQLSAERYDLSWTPAKERAALRRASLDLTRALAQMRRLR